MNKALVTLLLKSNKYPTHLYSYCTLSLSYTNIKIITETLARRIKMIMPCKIHPDQTGFIKTDMLLTTFRDTSV